MLHYGFYLRIREKKPWINGNCFLIQIMSTFFFSSRYSVPFFTSLAVSLSVRWVATMSGIEQKQIFTIHFFLCSLLCCYRFVICFFALCFSLPLLAHLPMVLFILPRETRYKTDTHTRCGNNKSIHWMAENKMCSELIKWVSRWKSFIFKLESIAIFQFALFGLVFPASSSFSSLVRWVSMDFFLKLSLCHGFDAKASSCSTRSDLFCHHHHHHTTSDRFCRTKSHWI